MIAKRTANNKRIAFARKLLDAASDIVSFVDKCLEWNEARKFKGLFASSFNISVKVQRSDCDERIIIRFLSPRKVHELW